MSFFGFKKEGFSTTFYFFGIPIYRKKKKDFKISRRFLFFRTVQIDVKGFVSQLLDSQRSGQDNLSKRFERTGKEQSQRMEMLAAQLEEHRQQLSSLAEQLVGVDDAQRQGLESLSGHFDSLREEQGRRIDSVVSQLSEHRQQLSSLADAQRQGVDALSSQFELTGKEQILRMVTLAAQLGENHQQLSSLTEQLGKVEAAQHQNLDALSSHFDSADEEQGRRVETLALQFAEYRHQLSGLVEQLGKVESIQNELKRLSSSISANLNRTQSFASESIWAQIFRDATYKSSWLKDKTFYPGRWAIGYPAMYVLYRVLNEAKPKAILELGLGQSTRMIAQYASNMPGVEHTVVENNQSWIDFFSADFPLSASTKIQKLDWVFKPYKEVEKMRVFDGFKETFSGKRFDLIFIDAPLGGDMKVYSRVDVLSILPDCLEKDFVIILDDYNRSGEKGTIRDVLACLDANKIAYKTQVYAGEKTVYLICSASYGWFASM